MTSPMLANEADGWTKLHGDPPPTLHHYTTGQGLLGMLQAGRLWATNAHFMNDPKEVTYAADIVQRAVRGAADRHKAAVDALDPGWMDKLITFGRDRAWKAPKIEQWSSDAIRTFDEQGGAYIACFCREPDLLSQWRGYGAVGGGYAVGFNSADLATRSTDMLLRKVLYDPTEQQAIVKRWVDAVFALDLEWREEQKRLVAETTQGGLPDWQALLKAFQGNTEAQARMRQRAKEGLTALNAGLERFSQFMIECLVCFKNPAYAAEEEWRLIVFGHSQPRLQFRVGRGCPIPYVELDLTAKVGELQGRLPISGISYGPVLESGMVARSLRTFLQAARYDHVIPHVTQSKVPYRA
jgi:Protein of unknown function (DUF2971)